MIWIVFIGGVVTGALSIGLIILAHEILEIGSDMDVIRRHTEREHAERLVDSYESQRQEALENDIERKILERKAQAPWN